MWGSFVVFHSYAYWKYEDIINLTTISRYLPTSPTFANLSIQNKTKIIGSTIDILDHISRNNFYVYCPFFPFTFCFVTLILEFSMSPLMAIYYFYKTRNFYSVFEWYLIIRWNWLKCECNINKCNSFIRSINPLYLPTFIKLVYFMTWIFVKVSFKLLLMFLIVVWNY